MIVIEDKRCPVPATLAGLLALCLAWAAPGGRIDTAAAVSAKAQAAKVQTPKTPAAKPANDGKPQLVGTYGSWAAYLAQGPKAKVCYALAQPTDRSPASVKRDQAYIFISTRPGEKVRNEISVIMGVPLKESSGEAKAEIGAASFELVTKGQNAWVKNAAQEGELISQMKKHGKLVVKAPVAKGGIESAVYSLAGLAQALDRVLKDCP